MRFTSGIEVPRGGDVRGGVSRNRGRVAVSGSGCSVGAVASSPASSAGLYAID